jgi:precorrin-2 methylase
MLYLVGLGLADEKDITVRGLEVVKSASRVYLEAYTSILLVDKEKLVRDILQSYSLDHWLTVCCDQLVGGFLWSPCHCCRS